MCQPPQPPPSSACQPGSVCPEATDEADPVDHLALQLVRHVGKKFYAFGASGKLESSDALTFRRTVELADAAIGGVLMRLLPSPNETDPGARLSVSEDDGTSWSQLSYELVETVDCTEVPCVALPAGILAFVAD